MQIIEVDSEEGGRITSVKSEEIKITDHKCPPICPDGLIEFMDAEEMLIGQGISRCRTQLDFIVKALNNINVYLENLEDRYKYLFSLRMSSVRNEK